MRNKKIILKLARVADKLDLLGHSDAADLLDEIITNEANWVGHVKKITAQSNPEVSEEVELVIPEEERALLEDVLKSLQESLE